VKRIYLIVFISLNYLNAGVDTVWVRRYNPPAGLEDEAIALIVDKEGNVYVTGKSESKGRGYDFLTVKYNPEGEFLWFARYDEDGRNDTPQAIYVDDSGNVYIAGTSERVATQTDYIMLKYNRDGNLIKVLHYDGGNEKADFLRGMVIDDSGNVYVTGESEGEGTDKDYLTLKYNREGELRWAIRYDNGKDDYATALTLQGNGALYVTGNSYSEDGKYHCITIKYDTAGKAIWIKKYKEDTYASFIRTDSIGNVYVAGNIYKEESGWDYLILKYDSSGNLLWDRYYNHLEKDSLCAFIVDRNGDVYVTGKSWNGHSYDYLTIKYNSDGNLIWIKSYDGPSHRNDYPTAITIDEEGVYITGGSDGGLSNWDYATVKYRKTDGRCMWVIRYNSEYGGTDIPSSIAVDKSGYLYVAGRSWAGLTWNDFLTIKYYQTTGIGEESPSFFNSLNPQISPNPAKGIVNIRYEIPDKSPISLKIYDVSGRLVKSLLRPQCQNPITYRLEWDGRDDKGNLLPAGVYFLRFRTKDFAETVKLVFIRQ